MLNGVLVGTQVPSAATVANVTWTSLEFVTTAEHNEGAWSGFNSTELTVPETGYYVVTNQMYWGATNGVQLKSRVSVDTVVRREVNFSQGANNSIWLAGYDIMYLTKNSVIEVEVYQASGGALAYGGTATPVGSGSYFSAFRLDLSDSSGTQGLGLGPFATKGRLLVT